jgi:hypothetical protein
MAARRSWYERPLLDWLVAGLITVVLALTPVQRLMTDADHTAQRAVMGNVASILGVVASFTIAALFFYAGADNPSARAVRARWGTWFAGAFLRSLGVVLIGAFGCAFTQLGVPGTGATVVFLAFSSLAVVKLGRIVLLVGALLVAEQADSAELPPLETRVQRSAL